MAINFPDNPTSNQIYSEVNKSWKWNGTAWIGIASTGPQGPQGPQGTPGVDGAGVAYSTSFNGPHDITESRNTGNAGNSLGPVTVDTGLSYIVGDLIIVSGDPSPGNFQTAQVISYDSVTGVMEWNHLQASTIYSNSQNWNINLTGAPGNDGATGSNGVVSYASYSVVDGNKTNTGVLTLVEDLDPDAIGTVSAGVVTLGAGTYQITHYGEYYEDNNDYGDYYFVSTRHDSVNQNSWTINENQLGTGSPDPDYKPYCASFIITSASSQTVDVYAEEIGDIFAFSTLQWKNVKLSILKLA